MVQLHTLGAVHLRRDRLEVRSVLSQPRRLALLVYLAAARPHGFHTRDRLIGLFWPDADEARARNALRQAVFQLRKSLGEGVIVSRGDHELGIDSTRLWCDVAVLDAALEEGRPEAAIDLYRGEFMPGFHVDDSPGIERWLEDERARLRRAAVDAAWTVADADAARGDLAAAVARGRQAMALDPLDEGSVRRLIELLDRSGERAAALQLFGEFERRLEAELGLAPGEETLRRVTELRSAPAATTAAAAVMDARPTPMPAPGPPCPPSVVTVRPVPRPRVFARQQFALVGVVALALSVVLFQRRARETGPLTAPEPTPDAAVAVLPFINMSGDPANEYFSDGMAEELSFALSRVPGLRVVGHTSAFSFKGKDVGVDSIGRALRVGYVLEGSVRATGNRVRILAQLIDAASGYHVWSETWDGDLSDVFAVQAEIAAAVVRELQPRLAGGSTPPAPAEPETRSAAAHAYVLRGYQALYAGEIADYRRADTLFTRALELDPDYARAHAGLAVTRNMSVFRRWQAAGEGYARAEAAALRALELDPSLAVAHSALGRIEEGRWNFAAADRHFMRAIELSPGTETWYRHRALLLAILGRHDESIALARRAVEIDPLATGAHRQLGVTYFQARQYENAVAAYDNALALAPGHQVALHYLAQALSMLGRHDEAMAAARAAFEKSPDDPVLGASAAWVHARAGDMAMARTRLARLEVGQPRSAYAIALVLAALGEHERAFVELQRAYDEGDSHLVELGVFPVFDPLRTDPRFLRLLQRIGLVS